MKDDPKEEAPLDEDIESFDEEDEAEDEPEAPLEKPTVPSVKQPLAPKPGISDTIGDIVEIADPRSLNPKEKRMRKSLGQEPLVRVIIPRDGKETKDARHGFTLNGFRFFVPKGRYVEVPRSVADMIVVAYQQSEDVLQNHPFNLRLQKDRSAYEK